MKTYDFLSLVFYPTVLTAILSVVFSVYSPIGLGMLNTAESIIMGIVFLSIMPTVPVLYYLRKGKVDMNVSVRESRPKFYFFAMLSQAIAVIAFLATETKIMFVYSLSILIVTIAVMVFTFRWKISGHSSGIACDAIAVTYVYGIFLLPVLILVPLISFVRYKAKAHSVAQLLAGAILSLALTFAVYFIFYRVS